MLRGKKLTGKYRFFLRVTRYEYSFEHSVQKCVVIVAEQTIAGVIYSIVKCENNVDARTYTFVVIGFVLQKCHT